MVGANGAGKSTLVRTIAGILPPSEGRVEIHGRVSTLLALGVGFNKELSGRDNIVLGGLAAGLKRGQLAEKYDDIVEFAGLEDFMDMPMRTYSSGMYGRLAFAVAVMIEPDILLIDEALSVGDAKFRRKCARKMRELCSEDRTVVLVSQPSARSRSSPITRSGWTRARCGCGTTPNRGERLHGVPRGRPGRRRDGRHLRSLAAAVSPSPRASRVRRKPSERLAPRRS